VIMSKDSGSQTLMYYIDTNCDGIVDLIAYQKTSSDTIDSYQRSVSEIRLDSIAIDFATALANGTIPYHQVHLCR
jgi:hypothetical protein